VNEFTYQQAVNESFFPSWLFLAGVLILGFFLAIFLLKKYIERKRALDIFLENRNIPGIIFGLNPSEFETWVQQLFLSIGAKANVTGKTGDHGIDVIAEYQGKRIGVQCKKYGHRWVGEPYLRDLYGVKWADGFDKVVLITTGNFSPPALLWAKNKPDLILINAKLLERIIFDSNVLRKMVE
jgi:HJR/Mrr/RecB family endonuclease